MNKFSSTITAMGRKDHKPIVHFKCAKCGKSGKWFLEFSGADKNYSDYDLVDLDEPKPNHKKIEQKLAIYQKKEIKDLLAKNLKDGDEDAHKKMCKIIKEEKQKIDDFWEAKKNE